MSIPSTASRPLFAAFRSTLSFHPSGTFLSRFASSAPESSSSSFVTASPERSSPAAAPSIARDDQKKYSLSASVVGFVTDPAPSSSTNELNNDWWRQISKELSHGGYPGNQYSGRSFAVSKGDYGTGYRRVMASLNRANIRKELRLAEFYEKPSVRKMRLASERHRRRFQEEVRQRVQLVQSLRNRK